MPWTSRNYPESLRNFRAEVRSKAVEIANALLQEGYDEGKAIAIATERAKEWATRRSKVIRKKTHETTP